MTTLNLTLPDSLMTFVEEQVASGRFTSPSEYVWSLIREACEQASTGLERHLEAALASPATEMTSGDWEDLRAEVRRFAAESRNR